MRTEPPALRPYGILSTIWVRVAMANLAGAVLAFIFFDRIAPTTRVNQGDGVHRHEEALAAFLAYVAVVLLLAVGLTVRIVRRDYAWAVEGRPPDGRERDVALREPFRLAAFALLAWGGGAVLFSVLNVLFEAAAVVVLRNAVGIVFGGVITSMLTYLLVEASVRPVWAVALAGGAPGRRHFLGVRPRLMLSWAVAAAVPLFGIGLAVVGPAHVEDPTGPVVFLVVIGVVGGWISMYAAARSVSDPLESVRQAVARVGEGDLNVAITVDDGGEVGELQAGVNRMVAGLRERQRLRDLFGRHVGDEVARQALARQAGLGGEQRDASALFVDLIGSTALAATLPADEVVANLNRLFGAVVRAAAAEGGWVNKFDGDGALCVFGAPADQPDHAARALRAAAAMSAELRAERLDVGIGVSSGRVVAGNVGSEERYEYTVIGDPVNEAARLCELAKTHDARVLVSEASVRAAGGRGGEWAVVGEYELRGRGRPTCAYAPAAS